VKWPVGPPFFPHGPACHSPRPSFTSPPAGQKSPGASHPTPFPVGPQQPPGLSTPCLLPPRAIPILRVDVFCPPPPSATEELPPLGPTRRRAPPPRGPHRGPRFPGPPPLLGPGRWAPPRQTGRFPPGPRGCSFDFCFLFPPRLPGCHDPHCCPLVPPVCFPPTKDRMGRFLFFGNLFHNPIPPPHHTLPPPPQVPAPDPPSRVPPPRPACPFFCLSRWAQLAPCCWPPPAPPKVPRRGGATPPPDREVFCVSQPSFL